MQHIPASAYLSMPWKNGLGVTLEIARAPAAPAEFAWRLSLASIAEDGPFSSYVGYERVVVLVDGDGFDLDFGSGDVRELPAAGVAAVVDGGSPVHCRLRGGPCRDLSLMVRLPGTVTATRVLDVATPTMLAGGSSSHRALFVLAGTVEAGLVTLGAGDSVLLESIDTALTLRPVGIAARVLLLEWQSPD